MKVVLDIPDTTMGIFVNYIFHDGEGVVMGCRKIDDELYSEEPIKCKEVREKTEQ